MKKYLVIIFTFFMHSAFAQELFVMTEPASNMPAGAIGIRAMNSFLYEKNGTTNYHLMPEIMWGASAKLMLHLQNFLSNNNSSGVNLYGGSVYAKYRFFSNDDLHKHFRMAAFVRLSKNKSIIHQEELETMGQNSGYELGFVATKLVNKIAYSTTFSFEKAKDNLPDYKFPMNQSSSATNYTLSIGKLVYPKNYTSLKQTNINLMCEFLGQTLIKNSKSYLDVVPSIQFIIHSQARVDVAYRKQLYTQMARTAPNGLLIKFEYTFYNVTK